MGRLSLVGESGDHVCFELVRLWQEHQARGDNWSGILRVPALSVGLYTLSAGTVDPQQPHSEDEADYVLDGRATLRVGIEDQTVQTGSIS